MAPTLVALALLAGPAHPTVVMEPYLDRTEGAFVVLVPRAWRTQGGMVRVNPLAAGGPGQSIEAKIDFAIAREPEGLVAIRWLPHVNHVVPSPYTITPSVNGMPVAPLPTPRAFALEALLPRLRPGATEVKVVEVTARPDVVRMLAGGPKAQALRQAGAAYRADAAAVVVAYREGGRRFRELLFVAIEAYEAMGSGSWSNAFTVAARAPDAEFDAWGPVAKTIVNSFVLLPSWIAAEARGQAQRGKIVEDTQRALAKLDREIADSRARTMAQIQDQQYLTLTGQERWVNPHTGRPELGSNEWSHRWQDGSGRVIYTDDGAWDPNHDPALHLSGFVRSQVQRR
ncbi:MAG: hypothetical protein U0229_01175 [Anaeromyxobacter sp.]